MMQYEEEGEKLKDKSACHGVRADLKMCLLESDCCKRVRYSFAIGNSEVLNHVSYL